MSKPIHLYSHATGPNPWKVAIILDELNIPYEAEYMDMSKLHQQPYESTNPNGRVPSIDDPNTGVTLWESGAIIEYLVKNYDKSEKISYSKTPESYHVSQWLYFQVSGQGPYFGQGAWFSNFHSEKIPSAIERYQNEIKRVTKVIDGVLAKNPSGVLVGDKVTYADLSFIPWYWMVSFIEKSGELEKTLHSECPAWSKWIKSLNERPAVKKAFDERMAKIQAQHS